jgi:hypothetical protein
MTDPLEHFAPEAIEPAAAHAIAWFVDSGVQDNSDASDRRGGVYGWRHLKNGAGPFLYTEITGYALSTFAELLSRAPADPRFAERMMLAGAWIVDVALHPEGGVRTRKFVTASGEGEAHYGFDSEILYAFDTGMALAGMCHLAAEKRLRSGGGDTAGVGSRYADAAVSMGEFLLRCQRADGSVRPYFNAAAGEWHDTSDKWSTQSGPFLAKLAIGWLLLAGLTGDTRFRAAAAAVCAAAMREQETTGRFVTFRDSGGTHLHPHTYACEGLLVYGDACRATPAVEAAARGIAWALDQQLSDGGLPAIVSASGAKTVTQRCDIQAQVLRLGTALRARGALEARHQVSLDRLAFRLLQFQQSRGPERGAFTYGQDEEGQTKPHANSWCTMFAIQALLYLTDAQNGHVPGLAYLV